MFENLSNAIKEDEDLDESTTLQLQSLETLFKGYFPELKEKEAAMVRNQSSTALDVSDILHELQDQRYDLQMLRLHVMFFRKWHSLSSGVLWA